MSRRVLALVPLAFLALPAPVHAAEPGSGFASLELSAVASGITYDPSRTTGEPVQVSSPFASSAIHLGAGNGISSIAWPGQLGASLGTTLIVAEGAPAAFEALNDPVLANAKSGTSPDASNTSVPGSTMVAHARTTDVSATATAAGVASAASTTGATYATSAVKATGPTTATGEATSSLRDISIAGVVHIGSITSVAHGTTDGAQASAHGSTEVTDVTVAGQSVSIGPDGLTVAGTALPTGPLLAGVESALAQAMITMTVSRPTTIVSGGSVQYATGSLVVSTPLGVTSFGGATLNLAATPGYVPPAPTGSTAPGPGVPVAGPVTAGIPTQPGTLPTIPASGSTLPPVLQSVVDVLRPLHLTTGYRWVYVVLGLAAAFGCATLFAGLPARWLPALEDTCPLEQSWERQP